MDWLNLLKERGYTGDTVFEDGRYEDLKTKLLDFGGEAVIFINLDPDNRLERLMKHGQFFDNVELRLENVTDLDTSVADFCKRNSEENKKFYHYSGFALQQNGVWSYNSWAFNGLRAIELCKPHLSYYGIAEFWGKDYFDYLDHSYKEYFFTERGIL